MTTQKLRPKKSLGQHFLRDRRIIDQIILHSGFGPSDLVVEIGPGHGELTLPLAGMVSRVIAIEKDDQLAVLLSNRLAGEGISNVTVVNQDVLAWDFSETGLYSQTTMNMIGNLPYNISTPFLERLIDHRDRIGRAVLMFQLEIAERLTAPPGNKTYGAMSVLVQYYAKAVRLLKVSRAAFFPRPKVDSMVVELDFEAPYPIRASDDIAFKRVVRAAFSHRRKTIVNSLAGSLPLLDRNLILYCLNQSGINPMSRAEELSIDDFLRLNSFLELTGPQGW
ncbi:Ribosomal RNA small subunit methyltransferase A [uncultured Desulfobacterium sp.]|uniref:Ribosomal RNA small subunit methyltransferase A n=1 Tax=uncultured Desulfobacterium sp. TaxID=201089 RepID=A0A445N2K9_9BACT|nr:Ribosomal RNA small subunit methyltransferase A [uncultured Desulfobacterium sp.]